MGCEAREGSSHRALIGVNTYPVHCDSISTPPSSLRVRRIISVTGNSPSASACRTGCLKTSPRPGIRSDVPQRMSHET